LPTDRRCLIIFCKEPEKGLVKTRLAVELGEEKSLNLYKAFLKDTLDMARSLSVDGKILAYDAPSAKPSYLKSIAEDFAFYRQQGEDLGRRMDNAFNYARELGFSHIVIIGSDSPTLPSFFVKEAFESLLTHDVVIGPSRDGGYYLIGIANHIPELFQDVEWSSPHTMEDTVKNLEKLNKKVSYLKPWYDIDTPENLKFLEDVIREGRVGSATFTRKALGL